MFDVSTTRCKMAMPVWLAFVMILATASLGWAGTTTTRGKSEKQLISACYRENAKACRDYAKIMERRELLRRAGTFYDMACVLKLSEACVQGGDVWTKRGNPDEAAWSYQRGCALGNPAGCEALKIKQPEPTATPMATPTPVPTPMAMPTEMRAFIETKVEEPIVDESEVQAEETPIPIPGRTPAVEAPAGKSFDYWKKKIK